MWRSRGRRTRLTSALVGVAVLATTLGLGAVEARAAEPGSISGTVTAPAGSPLPDVTVIAVPCGPPDATGQCGVDAPPGGASTTTGPDGRYTVTGLDAGTYRVGFADATFGVAYWSTTSPGTADFFEATPVPVTSGVDTPGIDQHYTASGGISGTVTSAGAPLAGASVTVTSSVGFGGASAVTGGDGAYIATGLADGAYKVRVTAPGHISLYYPAAVDFAGASDVQVNGGGITTGVDVDLPLAGAITGRITAPGGTPAGAFTVSASAGAVTASAPNRDDGTYTIDGLPAGEYTVSFTAAGETVPAEYYDDVVDATQARPVTVVVGQTTTGIDALIGPDPSLGGTVLGAGDSPLAGATVTVSTLAGAVVATATTGADGDYLFTRLADGTYVVGFTAAGYIDQYYRGAADRAAATPVAVAKHQPALGVDARLAPVPPPNSPPDARDDQAAAVEGFGPVAVDVLANDTDPDGDALHIVSSTGAEHGGTATCGTGSCTYLPSADQLVGPAGVGDGFGYTVSDGAATDSAHVTVNVTANATIVEGDHGWRRVDMTAVLASRLQPGRSVAVVYCVRPGTADRHDVKPGCERATVGPESDRVSLPVRVKGDRWAEGDEYAVVDVTAFGATVWDRHLTLVIHDDDLDRPGHGPH